MTGGGSPLYTSTDGGTHWSAPVRSQLCAGLSGGDTDLGVDTAGDVYQTDLWLVNACLSVSSNHGQSFAAGNPFGSELQPGDGRPWISYNRPENQLYIAYDGLDTLRVSSTAALINRSSEFRRSATTRWSQRVRSISAPCGTACATVSARLAASHPTTHQDSTPAAST